MKALMVIMTLLFVGLGWVFLASGQHHDGLASFICEQIWGVGLILKGKD